MDLCGSPSPTLLPKQGHLQQAAQDLVQAGLEYLQRRRLHSLPGQPGMPAESQVDLPVPTYQAAQRKAVVTSQCQSDWLIKMVVEVMHGGGKDRQLYIITVVSELLPFTKKSL